MLSETSGMDFEFAITLGMPVPATSGFCSGLQLTGSGSHRYGCQNNAQENV